MAMGKIAETVKGVADKVGAFANNPLGQLNFQNILAHAQASFVEYVDRKSRRR